MRDKIVIIGLAAFALVIAALILMFAFGSKTASQAPAISPAAVAVPFAEIRRGAHPMTMGRVNYLITSPSELTALWKMIGATTTPPEVDFANRVVLAVFAENAPGETISISRIEDTDTRRVSIIVGKAVGVCMKKLPATSAYEIVSAPSTTLPLTHVDTLATTSCPR
jgi:hypothetical protein